MKADTLDLRFGLLEHGWLPMAIRIGGDDIEIDAADMPTDPIRGLICFARFLLSNECGCREVEFHLEPGTSILTATKEAGSDEVSFELADDHIQLCTRAVLRVPVAIQLWRALRELQPEVARARKNQEWSWEFPDEQMALLTAEIDAERPNRH